MNVPIDPWDEIKRQGSHCNDDIMRTESGNIDNPFHNELINYM